MPDTTNDYTVGRGEVFFARFLPNTFVHEGERYIGNTPQFNITSEATNLEHFSSDRGIREKDKSIAIQVNRSATLVTDEIKPENVAEFFFGSPEALTVAALSGLVEDFAKVKQGHYYQLGNSKDNPSGLRNITGLVLTTSVGGTAFTPDIDYVLDAERGRFLVQQGGGINSGSALHASYGTAASTRTHIISGNQPVEGSMRYIAHNPEGKNWDYFFPYVKIRPNGDYALKSDEWQSIPFSIDILKRPGFEGIYVDGQPFVA